MKMKRFHKMIFLLILTMVLPLSFAEAAKVKKPVIKKIITTADSAVLKIKKNNSSCSVNIYRSRKKNSGFKKIGTTKKNTYLDSKLLENKIYYYKIRICKSTKKDRQYSKYSKVRKGKTKKRNPSDGRNTGAKPDTSKNNSIPSGLEEQALDIVNKERAKSGLPPVSMTSALQNASHARAKEIVRSFSHTRPNGTSCFTILKEFHISYRTCGENIAYGYHTAASVMNGWMNSQGHRENILNRSFSKIGIGHYNGYWVQLFTG